ncbi:MAG: L-histidine N(alpha)-methyltransferase [Gemmatimonadales bacterium]|jgi:dimethylhistidine N-methyltransferase
MGHIDLLTPQADFRSDLLDGLSAAPKATSPKHLYDERGSHLFDIECEQPEYYLPDAEAQIMERHARDIARCVHERPCIIEPGSGAAKKVRVLLDVMDVAKYIPIDISTEFLLESAADLQRDYPGVSIECISADFTCLRRLPRQVLDDDEKGVLFFPGSTIGNFEEDEAGALLGVFREILAPAGHLIIGVDLKKDRNVLERAYNDEAGIAASLHRNLLERANREAGANFDPSAFTYRAVYNAAKGRMEMYLVSRRDQEVLVDGAPVRFAEGERWHTQSSYKYSLEQFRELAERQGFTRVNYWTDSDDLMSVQVFRT